MAKNKEEWQPCPRCGSNRVQKVSMWAFLLGGVAVAGCSIWLLLISLIAIAGVIVGAIVFLLGLIGIIGQRFMPTTLYCKDCNNTWQFKSNVSNLE